MRTLTTGLGKYGLLMTLERVFGEVVDMKGLNGVN